MDVFEIMGIQRVTGEFEGRPYDNIRFHCLVCLQKDKKVEGLQGRITKQVSMKSDLFNNDLKIGDCVRFFYNEYKKVVFYEKM
nr:MAG TPA: RstB protein [Inoviridae sp.]